MRHVGRLKIPGLEYKKEMPSYFRMKGLEPFYSPLEVGILYTGLSLLANVSL